MFKIKGQISLKKNENDQLYKVSRFTKLKTNEDQKVTKLPNMRITT